MTVGQLVELLEQMPRATEVFTSDYNDFAPIVHIAIHKEGDDDPYIQINTPGHFVSIAGGEDTSRWMDEWMYTGDDGMLVHVKPIYADMSTKVDEYGPGD